MHSSPVGPVWTLPIFDDALKRQFTDVLQVTLARAVGVEGGFWQPTWGSIAYMKGLDRRPMTLRPNYPRFGK